MKKESTGVNHETGLINQQEIEQYQKMSGEMGMTGTRINLPIIKIGYDTAVPDSYGKFIKGVKGETGTDWQVIGDTFEAVRLVTRKTLRAYIGEGETMYTAEFDNPKEVLALFLNGDVVGEGTIKELKANNDKLKMNMVLYLLMGEELVRVYVKGASLAALFRFFQDVKFPKDAIYNTSFSLHPEKKGNINYFVIDYVIGTKYENVKKVLQLQQELRHGFQVIKEIRDNKYTQTVMSQNDEDQNAIDVSKIPF